MERIVMLILILVLVCAFLILDTYDLYWIH